MSVRPLKKLSRTQAVDAACILFSLNTEPEQLEKLAKQMEQCGLFDTKHIFQREWFGFVHAAIVAQLMVHAPNSVLVDYLRHTTALLKNRHIPKEDAKDFVDTHFSHYMEILGKEEQKNCPKFFFQKVYALDELKDVPPKALALISGTMAMLLSSVADKMERYDIQVN